SELGAQLIREGVDCSPKNPDYQAIVFPAIRDGDQDIEWDHGEIEFWYRPNYDSTDIRDQHQLVMVSIGGTNPPNLSLWMANQLIFSIADDKGNNYVTTTRYGAELWRAREWVHIRATWNRDDSTDSLQLYLLNQSDKPIHVEKVRGGWRL